MKILGSRITSNVTGTVQSTIYCTSIFTVLCTTTTTVQKYNFDVTALYLSILIFFFN